MKENQLNRPNSLALEALNIPQELKEFKQWVLWRYQKKGNKWSKVPLNPKTGRNASVKNFDDWSSLEFAEREMSKHGADGIGFVFTDDDPYIGVDLDQVIVKGVPNPTAKRFLDELKTYSELSPSSSGLHLIMKGKLPGKGGRSGNVEIYQSGRYFTFTGRSWGDISQPILDSGEAFRRLYFEFIKPKEKRDDRQSISNKETLLSDGQLLDQIRRSKKGDEFARLWGGQTGAYNSHSEADLALCNMLAFWTVKNRFRMDSLFRQSFLYRKKWDQPHYVNGETYGEHTITKAIEHTQKTYAEKCPGGNSPTEIEHETMLNVVRASDVVINEIKWLWPGILPLGKPVVLAGKPGIGKSQISLYIASVVSRGGEWPVTGERCDPGNVLILSAEDGAEETIVPRLKVYGANLDSIGIIKSIREDDAGERHFDMRRDVDELKIHCRKLKNVSLVIIDPISSYLIGTDTHRDAAVRSSLLPIIKHSEEQGLCLLAVTHLNKSESMSALSRVMGSIGFVAASRASYICLPDPSDADRSMMLPIKNNLAKDTVGFGYRIEEANVTEEIKAAKIIWDSKHENMTADEAAAVPSESDENAGDAKEFLYEELRYGNPVLSNELFERGLEQGFSKKMLIRAKKKLGVKPVKTSFKGPWTWQLNQDTKAMPS